MSTELVYLQCSIKVLCVKKSVLEKVPYLSGMINLESNGTYDNPAIIEGCSYKALKSILLSAESDFKKFDEQYFPEYEYFNIDTTKLTRNIRFPYKNTDPDTFCEIIKSNNYLRDENNSVKKNLRICVIIRNDEHLNINLGYGFTISSDVLKLLNNGDTIIVENYDNYTKIFVSIYVGFVPNREKNFYYLPNTSINYIKSYRIDNDERSSQLIEINPNKSYILRSTGILHIDECCSNNPIKNVLTIEWNPEIMQTNLSNSTIYYHIWRYPMNPKINIPNNIVVYKDVYYYDVTTRIDTNRIMTIRQCTKHSESWNNKVNLLEI